MQVGRIDVGASIKFLSQYPKEEEFLFPPLSCLEVVGEPRIEARPDGGELFVVPLRINANLRAATVGELIARRKRLHAVATRSLREELARGAAEGAMELDRILSLRHAGGVELLRGKKEMVTLSLPASEGSEIQKHGGIVTFIGSRWVTLWAPSLMLGEGKAYYEVEVLEAKGTLAAGVAGTCFRGGGAGLGDLGDDASSWGIYSFGKVLHAGRAHDFKCKKWLTRGTMLGVAVDLSVGKMLVSTRFPGDDDAAADNCDGDSCQKMSVGWVDVEWREVFVSGVAPGLAVGGKLFPVIAGGWNGKLLYNFGDCPMRLAPPDSSYLPFKEAVEKERGAPNPASIGAEAALAWVGAETEALLRGFDAVWERHEAQPAEDFNDDSIYRDSLVEILDAKTCAEQKRKAALGLLVTGVDLGRLAAVRNAPAKDFRSGKDLEAECPNYSWGLLLSGWLRFVKTADVPLACSPSLIALIWKAVFDAMGQGEILQMVRIGGAGGKTICLGELVPTLRLRAAGLHGRPFEHAVLGLLVAAAAKSGEGILLTDADLRGLEFSLERILDLATAVTACRLHGALQQVNGLKVERPADGQNLRECVLREVGGEETRSKCGSEGRSPAENGALNGQVPLGVCLDVVDWAFVIAEAAAGGWRALDVSDNAIDSTATAGLAIGLKVCTLILQKS
jgi:hypothetical protein